MSCLLTIATTGAGFPRSIQLCLHCFQLYLSLSLSHFLSLIVWRLPIKRVVDWICLNRSALMRTTYSVSRWLSRAKARGGRSDWRTDRCSLRTSAVLECSLSISKFSHLFSLFFTLSHYRSFPMSIFHSMHLFLLIIPSLLSLSLSLFLSLSLNSVSLSISFFSLYLSEFSLSLSLFFPIVSIYICFFSFPCSITPFFLSFSIITSM